MAKIVRNRETEKRVVRRSNETKRIGTRIKSNRILVFFFFGTIYLYSTQHIVHGTAAGKYETITSKNDIEVNAIGLELICRKGAQHWKVQTQTA